MFFYGNCKRTVYNTKFPIEIPLKKKVLKNGEFQVEKNSCFFQNIRKLRKIYGNRCEEFQSF